MPPVQLQVLSVHSRSGLKPASRSGMALMHPRTIQQLATASSVALDNLLGEESCDIAMLPSIGLVVCGDIVVLRCSPSDVSPTTSISVSKSQPPSRFCLVSVLPSPLLPLFSVQLDSLTRDDLDCPVGGFVDVFPIHRPFSPSSASPVLTIQNGLREAKSVFLTPCLPSSMDIPIDYMHGCLVGRPLLHGGTARIMFRGMLSAYEVMFCPPSHMIQVVTHNSNVHIQKASDGRDPTTLCQSMARLAVKSNDDSSTVSKSIIQNSLGHIVGGMKTAIQIIEETVKLALIHPEWCSNYGLQPPHGILLYGSPGTGKTLLARSVAQTYGAELISLSASDVMSKYYGESEDRLRQAFNRGRWGNHDGTDASTPCILFIDEIDALAPKRESASSETEKRVVATLLTLMDGIHENSIDGNNDNKLPRRILVIAATNRIDVVDEALRRPGRFDREVEIPVPSVLEREDILNVCLRNVAHNLSSSDIREAIETMHGFVGADIAAVVREAAMAALRRQSFSKKDFLLEGCDPVMITDVDLRNGMTRVKPSAMREIILEIPSVRWSDIGGQEETKQRLRESVEWPLKHPDVFRRMGIRPPRGVLLYGPPGCSKTLMAKALATEVGLNFIAVKGPELFSKWVGESERAVRAVFRKARQASPSIIFFDEIDALAVKRSSSDGVSASERVLSQLLAEMDGIDDLKDVTIIAATNRPDLLDAALLRPGRFDRHLYVGLPDLGARCSILKIHTKYMPLGNDVELDTLAETLEGYTGAELSVLCREAALAAMEESNDMDHVHLRHFHHAFNTVTRRTPKVLLELYDRFQKKI